MKNPKALTDKTFGIFSFSGEECSESVFHRHDLGLHDICVILARNNDMCKHFDSQKIQGGFELLRGKKIGGRRNCESGRMIMRENNHGCIVFECDFCQSAYGDLTGIYTALMNHRAINGVEFVVQ